jgi:hypothetical protein
MDKDIWYCAGCGSTEIKVAVWLNPNKETVPEAPVSPLDYPVNCKNCGGDAEVVCDKESVARGRIQRLQDADALLTFVQPLAHETIVYVWYSFEDGPVPTLAYTDDRSKAPESAYVWKVLRFKGSPLASQHRRCQAAVDKARNASSCHHKECVQHFIDTMRFECIREGNPISPEDLKAIDRVSDELYAVAQYNMSNEKPPALVDVLRETIASYLGCVVEDKGWREETFGGFEHNLRGALGAKKKRS